MTTSTETVALESNPRRDLLASFKTSIKQAAIQQRADKLSLRDSTDADDRSRWQSNIASTRLRSRARLLVYGFLRGRSWDRTESNHPIPLTVSSQLTFALTTVWREMAIGTGVEPPQELAPWLLKK